MKKRPGSGAGEKRPAPLPIPTKDAALEPFREHPEGTVLTTDQGIPIPHTDDSLRAGLRGPSLIEDFHLREKITRFDHERIPERVVHARGSAAHGHFQVYQSLARYTRASFLQDPSVKTPVFVRFSTVGGSRGSADTVRDVRGFATKFYTSDGNFDLVGNNMPVFFIQDGIKFPDFVHAVKPEPDHEMPQASSAHDSFYDFCGLQPESLHMVLWLMSDRAIPRSLATMEGFGVHTFRLIDARGTSRFAKFHWKPLKGVHSLAWDEAQKIAGKDPDFHRRDLWESIARGDGPEFELGLQIVEEKDEHAFAFDLLDPTKLIPEELVPVERVGKLVLDRNPQNFFAETEQVAFCVSNLVPGIDVTNDPLMQARLFSYLDTQLTRLGGPNFATIPINRPVAPVHNHQQDGAHRDVIPTGKANYHPNTIGGGCPFLASAQRGYSHFPQAVEGEKTRVRAPSFGDHYSQARMFLASQSPPERRHLTRALTFELGKVERKAVRERFVGELANVDLELAREVADGIGVAAPKRAAKAIGAPAGKRVDRSPALSIANLSASSVGVRGRKVAALVADGVDGSALAQLRAALAREGALLEVVGARLGAVSAQGGQRVEVDKTFQTSGGSVMYDAVFVPGGAGTRLTTSGDARIFVAEAFQHCKPIAAVGDGAELLRAANVDLKIDGILVGGSADKKLAAAFIGALSHHRFWGREEDPSLPR